MYNKKRDKYFTVYGNFQPSEMRSCTIFYSISSNLILEEDSGPIYKL